MSDDPTDLLERAAERGYPRGAEEVWQRASADAERQLSKPTRARRVGLVAATLAVVVAGVAVALADRSSPESVTAGPSDQGIALARIPEGITPWTIGNQSVFISRNDDTFSVFIADPHHLLGETLLWCEEDNLFTGAEHGEQFDRLGQKIGGPQYADLSRMAASVDDGRLFVTPSSIIRGDWIASATSHAPPEREHPPYRYAGCKDGIGADDTLGTAPGSRPPGATKGRIPESAIVDGTADRSQIPDFIPALGPDGERAGWIRYDDVWPQTPDVAANFPIPVYDDDLTTLLGFLEPDGRFVAAGTPGKTRETELEDLRRAEEELQRIIRERTEQQEVEGNSPSEQEADD